MPLAFLNKTVYNLQKKRLLRLSKIDWYLWSEYNRMTLCAKEMER